VATFRKDMCGAFVPSFVREQMLLISHKSSLSDTQKPILCIGLCIFTKFKKAIAQSIGKEAKSQKEPQFVSDWLIAWEFIGKEKLLVIRK
jgi:hypothetical protein